MPSKRVTLSALVQSATLRPQAELVPLIRRNLGVGAFDLRSLAFDHMIETDIVLERIGAHDVVVVGIAEPDGDAASLIDFPGNRLESNRNVHVAGQYRLVDGERKPVVGPIRA